MDISRAFKTLKKHNFSRNMTNRNNKQNSKFKYQQLQKRAAGPSLIAKWSKALPLGAHRLSPVPGLGILEGACEKVAGDLG